MLTRHHIVPRSRGGTNHEDNIAMLPERQHAKIHALFSNLAPHEQMQALYELSVNTLKYRTARDIYDILNREPVDIYENYVLKNGILIPR